MTPLPPAHVNAAGLHEIEAPSAGEGLVGRPLGARPARRSRWPTGAAAARVHRCSRTSTRPSRTALASPLLAACASTASADRCFNEHYPGSLEHPGPGGSVVGTAAFVDRSFPFDLGDRRRFTGSGAEDHRASTLPPGIAPARDFAPTPIASDSSRRGHCQSPCQESARETGEAASAAHASKARAAGGPCDARSPRRDPAFTSPRGLPS